MRLPLLILHVLAGTSCGRPRILRHLWRMCFGLFFATMSFFVGQQQVFPKFLRGSLLLTVLAFLPLPVMIYWLFRVRWRKAYVIEARTVPAPVVR